MADYYTHFSFIVSLASAEQQTYALELFRQMHAIREGDDIPPDFPSALKEVADDCVFNLDPGSEPHELWFHSDTGGTDAVCAFVQHLLARFQLNDCVTFEWSHDCSKPRTDAYGGGAAVITTSEIKSFSTTEWLREQTQLQPTAH